MLLVAAIAAAPGLGQGDGEVLRDLREHGLAVVGSALPGALEFEAAIQTMERPMRAYKLTFETASPVLLKSPNADTDRVAYLRNSGNTELWQRKFCSADLISLMVRHGVDLVSADLQDRKGETQSLAICAKPSGAAAALPPVSKPEPDFEVGESRSWTDWSAAADGEFTIFTILREGDDYSMYRIGRYRDLEAIPVERAGARLTVLGDSEGTYFIVRKDGLAICNAHGCSRIAKADPGASKYREGEIAAKTDAAIAKAESQAKIEIRRDEPGETSIRSEPISRTPEQVVDAALRAQVGEWFSENLPKLRGWGSVLSSMEASYRDIRVPSTETERLCGETLARPPAQLAGSGDADLDEAVAALRSKTLEALRICTTGNPLSAQILVGQAMTASRRVDKRLRSLGIVAAE